MVGNKQTAQTGVKAALRWLFGTNAAMRTEEAQHEADVAVGEPLHKERQADHPIDRAMRSIERMEESSRRFEEAVPARSVQEALEQIIRGH